MDYIKVINPGMTYTTLVGSNQDTDLWGAHITNNVLPIRDKTYRVIKELYHPNSSTTRIMTILDENYTAFIIGVDGVAESTEDEFYREQEPVNSVKIKQQKPIRPIPVKHKDKYEIGDLIKITSTSNIHFNKILRVTDPNYRGYDVVTSRTATGDDRAYGFYFGDFERYIPEPELLPEDKPKFSTNELLEVLRQNKPADEVLLDLMDHITN